MNELGIVVRRILLITVAFSLAAILSCAPVQTKSANAAAKTKSNSEKKKQSSGQMTEAELQSALMSFADRYAETIFQAFEYFEPQAPTAKARLLVLSDAIYSTTATFNIAAEANPKIALLDLVVLTTLGRMIYEEHYLVEFGEAAAPMVKGFRTLEADIWQIVARLFTTEQQEELMNLIRTWRENHPELLTFAFQRFSDFAAERKQSTLVQQAKSGGLFKSVKKATEEVEQMRLLAERALYLGTRMPLLTGDFVDLWLSRWILNPEVQKVVGDVHTFSKVSERLATVAEQLPDDIATERRNLLLDLESQQRALSQTMREAKELIALVNETTHTVDTVSLRIDKMLSAPGEGRRPFDIMDYYNTVSAASDTVNQVNSALDSVDELLASPNWEQKMPVVLKLTDAVESQGEEFMTHVFLLGLGLMLIFFLGMFLLIRYATRRYAGLRKE